jgi:iron complex outermembrane receptor protein
MFISDAPPPAPTQEVVVVGTRQNANVPNSSERVTTDALRTTNNVRNSEDALRYFPSLFVRKRHIGDTQAPVATRTSGVGASARSLIYADGVLLSALIGNNNSFASPRWGMVAPEEIDRVEVLYGPFSAAYPGNAIGTVVNITTRLPEKLEMSATAAVNSQKFDQYGTKGTYPAYQFGATAGDRIGRFGWFLSGNHTDSRSQPLAYVTVARPAGTSANGTPVEGAFERLNRTGQPTFVIGGGGFERQRQDNLKLKLGFELTPSVQIGWRTGLFLNDTNSRAQSFLTETSGEVFAGTVNIGGRAVTIPASAFSNQVYRFDERHWMHSATVEGSGKNLSWSVIGSVYDYAKSDQRIPSTALPGAAGGGAGSIVRMAGTGWKTLDAKFGWHGLAGHDLSGGAHFDLFALRNRRHATSDWREGSAGAVVQESQGRTRTAALWLQDRIALLPALSLTLGGRYEWWRAFDGLNFSATPALNVEQPTRTANGLSPKASLRWEPLQGWSATLSAARALRFPTVSELYQAVTTGPTISVPNPNLKPEDARSQELAVERTTTNGRMRLSLFRESVRDALLSQSAPLVPGSSTLFNYVQNIGRTRTRGAELVIEHRNVLDRIDLSGSITLADPRIVSNPVLPVAEGKLIPQVPKRRATLVATWRATDAAAFTLAGRYSSRLFGTIDNSDIVGHTYQGFEGYFVADARAAFRLSRNLRLAVGVENLTDKRYFLFHPFPGRTLTAEVGWNL